MKRAYTALTSTTDPDADLVTALRWAQAQAGEGQRVTLWCHHRDALPNGLESAAARSGIVIRAERPRPRHGPRGRHFSGPVVAVDLSLETLIQVEPFAYPLCLAHAFVTENGRGDLGCPDLVHDRPWIDAFLPECLVGPPIVPNEPLIEDPVIVRALKSFTSTTFNGTTMTDYRDGGVVTHGLMELRRTGHTLHPDRLLSAALRAGWQGTQALAFRDVAREVARGVNKRPKRRYPADIVNRWQAELHEATATRHPTVTDQTQQQWPGGVSGLGGRPGEHDTPKTK